MCKFLTKNEELTGQAVIMTLKRKYKSGATKKKEKKEKHENSVKNTESLQIIW